MIKLFVEKRFSAASEARIKICNQIIGEYLAQGYRLTLRQLYYQLVSRAVIPNEERSYKNLSSLISDARLAGLVDWDAIEDRVRVPRQASEFENLEELVEAAVASYRLPRWDGQQYYAELWVEKDALAGVLEPLSRQFHVTLMVNKGYSSQSAMYEASKRFLNAATRGQKLVLFYLGDHDPSGEDMVRDIYDRLYTFGVIVTVQKIALTIGQVRQYNPPPNPAKITDPRASGYIARFGNSSWEVDALPPNVLSTLVQRSLRSVIDKDKMDAIMRTEAADKEALRAAVKGLGDTSEER